MRKFLTWQALKSTLATTLCVLLAVESVPASPVAPVSVPLSLPSAIGFVTDAFAPAGKNLQTPDVVVVQDLHVNRSVQLAISRILGRLKTQHWLPAKIGVEGAVGPIEVRSMQQVPGVHTRKSAADYLLQQGEMPGDMHFVVTEGEGELYGLETGNVYSSIVDLYRQSYEDRTGLKADLDKLRQAIILLSHDADPQVRANAAILTTDVDSLATLVDQRIAGNEIKPALRRATLALEHLQMILPVDQARDLLTPVSAAVNFYMLALMRDGELFKNLLQLRQAEHQTTSVIVIGGFHTPGLIERLKKENLSYVVITPNVHRHTRIDEKLYVERMLGHHLTSEQVASGIDWASQLVRQPLAPDLQTGLFPAAQRRRAGVIAAIGLYLASYAGSAIAGPQKPNDGRPAAPQASEAYMSSRPNPLYLLNQLRAADTPTKRLSLLSQIDSFLDLSYAGVWCQVFVEDPAAVSRVIEGLRDSQTRSVALSILRSVFVKNAIGHSGALLPRASARSLAVALGEVMASGDSHAANLAAEIVVQLPGSVEPSIKKQAERLGFPHNALAAFQALRDAKDSTSRQRALEWASSAANQGVRRSVFTGDPEAVLASVSLLEDPSIAGNARLYYQASSLLAMGFPPNRSALEQWDRSYLPRTVSTFIRAYAAQPAVSPMADDLITWFLLNPFARDPRTVQLLSEAANHSASSAEQAAAGVYLAAIRTRDRIERTVTGDHVEASLIDPLKNRQGRAVMEALGADPVTRNRNAVRELAQNVEDSVANGVIMAIYESSAEETPLDRARAIDRLGESFKEGIRDPEARSLAVRYLVHAFLTELRASPDPSYTSHSYIFSVLTDPKLSVETRRDIADLALSLARPIGLDLKARSEREKGNWRYGEGTFEVNVEWSWLLQVALRADAASAIRFLNEPDMKAAEMLSRARDAAIFRRFAVVLVGFFIFVFIGAMALFNRARGRRTQMSALILGAMLLSQALLFSPGSLRAQERPAAESPQDTQGRFFMRSQQRLVSQKMSGFTRDELRQVEQFLQLLPEAHRMEYRDISRVDMDPSDPRPSYAEVTDEMAKAGKIVVHVNPKQGLDMLSLANAMGKVVYFRVLKTAERSEWDAFYAESSKGPMIYNFLDRYGFNPYVPARTQITPELLLHNPEGSVSAAEDFASIYGNWMNGLAVPYSRKPDLLVDVSRKAQQGFPLLLQKALFMAGLFTDTQSGYVQMYKFAGDHFEVTAQMPLETPTSFRIGRLTFTTQNSWITGIVDTNITQLVPIYGRILVPGTLRRSLNAAFKAAPRAPEQAQQNNRRGFELIERQQAIGKNDAAVLRAKNELKLLAQDNRELEKRAPVPGRDALATLPKLHENWVKILNIIQTPEGLRVYQAVLADDSIDAGAREFLKDGVTAWNDRAADVARRGNGLDAGSKEAIDILTLKPWWFRDDFDAGNGRLIALVRAGSIGEAQVLRDVMNRLFRDLLSVYMEKDDRTLAKQVPAAFPLLLDLPGHAFDQTPNIALTRRILAEVAEQNLLEWEKQTIELLRFAVRQASTGDFMPVHIIPWRRYQAVFAAAAPEKAALHAKFPTAVDAERLYQDMLKHQGRMNIYFSAFLSFAVAISVIGVLALLSLLFPSLSSRVARWRHPRALPIIFTLLLAGSSVSSLFSQGLPATATAQAQASFVNDPKLIPTYMQAQEKARLDGDFYAAGSAQWRLHYTTGGDDALRKWEYERPEVMRRIFIRDLQIFKDPSAGLMIRKEMLGGAMAYANRQGLQNVLADVLRSDADLKPALLAALHGSDEYLGQQAGVALSLIGNDPSKIPFYIEEQAAARTSGDFDRFGRISWLLHYTTGGDEALRKWEDNHAGFMQISFDMAVDAILNPARSLETRRNLLGELVIYAKRPNLKQGVANALGFHKDELKPILLAAANDPDPAYRGFAKAALRLIGVLPPTWEVALFGILAMFSIPPFFSISLWRKKPGIMATYLISDVALAVAVYIGGASAVMTGIAIGTFILGNVVLWSLLVSVRRAGIPTALLMVLALLGSGGKGLSAQTPAAPEVSAMPQTMPVTPAVHELKDAALPGFTAEERSQIRAYLALLPVEHQNAITKITKADIPRMEDLGPAIGKVVYARVLNSAERAQWDALHQQSLKGGPAVYNFLDMTTTRPFVPAPDKLQDDDYSRNFKPASMASAIDDFASFYGNWMNNMVRIPHTKKPDLFDAAAEYAGYGYPSVLQKALFMAGFFYDPAMQRVISYRVDDKGLSAVTTLLNATPQSFQIMAQMDGVSIGYRFILENGRIVGLVDGQERRTSLDKAPGKSIPVQGRLAAVLNQARPVPQREEPRVGFYLEEHRMTNAELKTYLGSLLNSEKTYLRMPGQYDDTSASAYASRRAGLTENEGKILEIVNGRGGKSVYRAFMQDGDIPKEAKARLKAIVDADKARKEEAQKRKNDPDVPVLNGLLDKANYRTPMVPPSEREAALDELARRLAAGTIKYSDLKHAAVVALLANSLRSVDGQLQSGAGTPFNAVMNLAQSPDAEMREMALALSTVQLETVEQDLLVVLKSGRQGSGALEGLDVLVAKWRRLQLFYRTFDPRGAERHEQSSQFLTLNKAYQSYVRWEKIKPYAPWTVVLGLVTAFFAWALGLPLAIKSLFTTKERYEWVNTPLGRVVVRISGTTGPRQNGFAPVAMILFSLVSSAALAVLRVALVAVKQGQDTAFHVSAKLAEAFAYAQKADLASVFTPTLVASLLVVSLAIIVIKKFMDDQENGRQALAYANALRPEMAKSGLSTLPHFIPDMLTNAWVFITDPFVRKRLDAESRPWLSTVINTAA